VPNGNKKTGRMPVSKTSASSCPPGCPFLGAGCYGEYCQTGTQHWKAISTGPDFEKSLDLSEFTSRVRSFKPGQPWRHNEAGDLPGEGNRISESEFGAILESNTGRSGFTYTHKPVLSGPESARNRRILADARHRHPDFIVNLSADNPDDAVRKLALDLGPVCMVLPVGSPKVQKLDNGVRVVQCPADAKRGRTCLDCRGFCRKRDRDFVVGFEAHGVKKRQVSGLVSGS
jgi:hypothetical protein